MIKALYLTKLLPRTALKNFTRHFAAQPSYSTYKSLSFSFSVDRQPRNKEEAWMMQQQKALNSGPASQQQQKTYSGVSRTGIIGFVILVAGLAYIVYAGDARSKEQLDFFEEEIKGLTEAKTKQSLVGGEWTLINSDGEAFSSRMLSGYYYLVYFGYTKCPDMSPNTLYYISSLYRIIRNLPEGAYLKLKIVFVSIDPERDRPEVLKSYLSNFSKNIIGVTGSSANDIELKECMKKFKIKSQKVTDIKGLKPSDYLIDHTRRVFLMDPQNVYLYHLDLDASEQRSAKAVIAKIIQNENLKEKMEGQMGS